MSAYKSIIKISENIDVVAAMCLYFYYVKFDIMRNFYCAKINIFHILMDVSISLR